MGTTATIIITNNRETTRYFKHCDGNPSAILTDLSKGKIKSGATKHDSYKAPFEARKHLNNDDYQEWLYIVNTDTKTVAIYGAECEDGAYNLIRRGTIDPMVALEQLEGRYKVLEQKATERAMKAVEIKGWKIQK